MKKCLSLVMAILLVASLMTFAFAYDKSPTSAELPNVTVESADPDYPAEIIKTETINGSEVVYIQEEDTCYDELIVTPYSRKDGMPDVVRHGGQEYVAIARQSQADLEKAYQEIMTLENSNQLLSQLPGVDANFAKDLEAAVKAAGTTMDKIYVSDLFDVTYYECIDDTTGSSKQPQQHMEDDAVNDEHARVYKINVDDFVLQNFVALLHRPSDMNGKWEVVKTTVDTVNNTISFKVNVIARNTQDPADNKDDEVNLSPFAIVVKKTDGYIGNIDSPKTADPVSLLSLSMAMVASAGGVTILSQRKKNR